MTDFTALETHGLDSLARGLTVIRKRFNDSDNQELSLSFAVRLYDLRTHFGLTRSELARRSGLSPDTINAIERKSVSPSLRTLAALADGLGMKLTNLIGG